MPAAPADFLPVSVTPALSRMVERELVLLTFTTPPMAFLHTNLYAFRPTGSTTAALISILHHITKLLETNNYVTLVSFYFFKTCDMVQHSTLAAKLSSIDLPDNIFNWLVDFLKEVQRSSLNGFRPSYPKAPASCRAGELAQLPSLSIHLTSIWYISKIGWSNMLMTHTCWLDPLREPRSVRIWNQ